MSRITITITEELFMPKRSELVQKLTNHPDVIILFLFFVCAFLFCPI